MNLKLVLGDTEEIEFIVVDRVTREAMDITGWQFWFTVKKDNANEDVDAVIQKIVGEGIEIVEASIGKALVTVNPEDRALVTAARNYKWDIQAKDAAGRIVTIAGLDGNLEFTSDTTRAIS